jgi:hypothetical protein
MDAGAAGGSSERSSSESSGSGMSSNAATERVGTIGSGASAGSDSNEFADVEGTVPGEGVVENSAAAESVGPGVEATRATRAARALGLPVVAEFAEAAAVVEGVGAEGSGRESGPALVVGAVADFVQRPDVEEAPAAGVCEAAPDEGGVPGLSDAVEAVDPVELSDPIEVPDVGDATDADELPGFAGRGGGLAAGGGEAAGAGRAGGTVGIADFGTALGAVAVRADVAEVAGVADVAPGDAEERLASIDVGEADLAAAGRVAG